MDIIPLDRKMDNRSNIVYYDPHVYSVDMLYVYPMLRGLGQPSIHK